MKKILHNKKIFNYPKKKKIGLIFNHSYFLGGGEISFFELIKSLNQDLFEPVVIVPGDGEIKRKLEAHRFKVIVNPLPSLKRFFLGLPLYQLFKLLIILHKNNIDLVHANGSRSCFYAGLSGKILSIPAIWHVRESMKDSFIYDYLLGVLASVIICVSKSVKLKRFKRFGKRLNNKICVVYNGVDIDKFRNFIQNRKKVRANLRIKSSDILVGLIGNIIPRKSQDFFLKGFAEVKKIQPNISIKVLIIGRYLDKQFNDYLRVLVTDLNLNSNVIFHEFSDEIEGLFSALDIFVLSSKSEGFCRSLLEAMSCSLPVIATKISEIEEAIVDNKNGILVDFMNIEKMTNAIITMCNNKSMRMEFSARNRSDVEKKFSLVSHSNAIEQLYLSSIQKNAHHPN